MCKSSTVLGQAVDDLELVNLLRLDHETAIRTLSENVDVKVIPDTRLIEISATFAHKEMARDVAAEIPRKLLKFEKKRVETAISEKIAKLDELILKARDTAAEKTVQVTRIGKIHGQDGIKNEAARELERARRASLIADADVERLLVLQSDAATSMLNSEPRMVIHTEPVIADSPCNPKVGPGLNDLALEALAAGIIVALLLPYLCELAFPLQNNRDAPLDVIYDM